MLCYAFYNCLHFYIESDSVSLGVSWFLLAILYNYYKYKDITLAVLETLEYLYFFSILILSTSFCFFKNFKSFLEITK